MNYESVENHASPESTYRSYVELGGIINEKDYHAVMTSWSLGFLDKKSLSVQNSVKQVEGMVRYSGIFLGDSEDALDQRVALYTILRCGVLSGKNDQHIVMCDQRLFFEVLRILGDSDSLKKLVLAYPNVSF